MLRSGWFRLWVVATVAVISIFFVAGGYVAWGRDVCYRYVSISTKSGFVSDSDMEVVDHLRKEASSREYCGETVYSALITLEQLANRGVVTQVGYQWREPRGWTFSDFDSLDILESKEISASTLIERVNKYVHRARVDSLVLPGVSLLSASLALLLLGLGIAWVRNGFTRSAR